MQAPKAGSKLGGYQLEAHLARGGMADIFVARSPHGHRVAIKCIRPNFTKDPVFVELFLREAALSMTLEHGNIARVFDFGEADGTFYLVMEYVDGPALWDLQRAARELGERFDPGLALHVIAETAAGLAHAHARTDTAGAAAPIVHRDISPQNILVARDGAVKIVDFGIAKARDSRDLTRPGVARGKYLYFSPEQVRQQPLDGKSDVYACGVILYALLCGRRPFEGDLLEVLGKITAGDYPAPRSLRPQLSSALAETIVAALSLEPRARPSALAFEAGLRGHLRATPGHDPAIAASAIVSRLWSDALGSPDPVDMPGAARDRQTSPSPLKARLLAAGLGAVAAIALGSFFLLGGTEQVDDKTLTRIDAQPPGSRITIAATDLQKAAPTPKTVSNTGGGPRAWPSLYPGLGHAVDSVTGLARGPLPEGGQGGPWPLATLTLNLDAFAASAARLPLDPKRRHRISTRGRVEVLRGLQPIHQVFYFARHPHGPERFGFLDARKPPIFLPRGPDTLLLLLLDPSTARADGPTLRDLVVAWPEGALEVRTRTGSVSLRYETQRAQLRRSGALLLPLRAMRRTELGVHLSPDARGLFPERIVLAAFRSLGTLGQADPEASAPIFTALEDGDTFTLEQVNDLWIFTVSADPSRAAGTLTLDLRDRGPAASRGSTSP